MLPSVVSREIIEAVRLQLKAQFPSTTDGFLRDDGQGSVHAAIDDLLNRPGEVFKGPYLSLGLPFRRTDENESLPFQHLVLPYSPYRHQMKAFQRLTGPSPQPTLVATGTGSGKTECFMYPLLDHCASTTAPGVKALVIYPMNALAQDQARRFAAEVHNQEGLRGKVTVGIYTGDSKGGRTTMTADSVITDRAAQQRNPPDILLTNYKMLDFLLIRPKDRQLWRYNEPGVLKFLVVDELHTFDGAQGTDLACLIRRLKDRLGSTDDLACVGTSATVGDDVEALTDYASSVFDTRFRSDSVLREERLTAAGFLPSTIERQWPDAEDVQAFAQQKPATRALYLQAAAQLWLGDELPDPEMLGSQLATLAPFRELLEETQDVADKTELVTALCQRWQLDNSAASSALDALIALASTARDGKQPYVTVREQLWLRELRRMVATVSASPRLCFRDDLAEDRTAGDTEDGGAGEITLPVVHCNNCHATGWLALRRPTELSSQRELVRDVRQIYDGFFNKLPDTVTLYAASNTPSVRGCNHYQLCSHCGVLNPDVGSQPASACAGCERDSSHLVAVVLPIMTRAHTDEGAHRIKFHNDCPFCDARESLFILGSRAATLSSVAINQLFNSRFNTDAKLIAFSDSVQDAAHRAGFFAARTYRQVIRQALGAAIASGQFNTLAQVIEGFGTFWHQHFLSNGQTDADFVATFLAPDLAWLNDWEALQQTDKLPASSDLVQRWVLPRLRWEALMAFGLQARTGRTLERTGAAIVHMDAGLVDRVVETSLIRLNEEIAELRSLDSETLRQFVQGLLWHLRTRGALFDPLLERYVQSAGNAFELRNNRLNPYLPRLGTRSTLPLFLSLHSLSGRGANRFDSVLVKPGASWYQHWFNKLLTSDNVMASASLASAYSIVLNAAEKHGITSAHDVREHTVWGLNTSLWQVSTRVVTLVCDSCQHRLQVAEAELEQWQGMPCMRSHCLGHHQSTNHPSLSDVFSNAADTSGALLAPTRLVTAEHTAVLDTETRARTEHSFKRNPGERWDINLLSATPTMEMGVDIGDLSSVLLCSVPPAQANYLQRIGRAGRKDGNAFNLTIANGVPHDLYFYADPIEMMRGSIQPPGVFLGAIAVLERQLLAFCMDRWVQTDIADDAIPALLRDVLDAVDSAADKQFPQPFLLYVERERGVILRDFLNLFLNNADSAESDRLNSYGSNQLNNYLYGMYDVDGGKPGITSRLTTLFLEKASQRRRFRKDIDKLKRDRQRLEQLPVDEERDADLVEVIAERAALQRLVRGINRQQTLNFLTDEGVLPNYAFPEEGVKLNSVIYRRRQTAQSDDAAGSPYERIELEIRRPAQVALRELAPHSRFYGNSRQVQIDQVMVNRDDVETWRFCASCNHGMSVMLTDEYTTCPRCGHADWSSVDQKMTLLKLREVYANASDRDSRIGDDSDDREPVFFNRQFLFDLDEKVIERGWRIDEPNCPFGFEYLSRATFREINFGRVADRGTEIRVAGNTSQRAGFPVCKHCGKVRMWRPRQQDNHTRRCPMYEADEELQKQNAWNALYLYRQLQSEAVRLLLPIADIAQSEKRLQSFIAALHLGLKKRFRGNVDHLQIMYVSEPVAGTDLRRHFLVLLDSVPGGTGYLSELLKTADDFRSMLLAAKHALEACSCNADANKDGCYRCLYAYRESHKIEETSRTAALETLNLILSHWDKLAQLETGDNLSHTDVNALFDSELERRFIDVLAARRGCSIERHPVNGKDGYYLTIKHQSDGSQRPASTRWSIEPQVDLGESQGIARSCRPDFVMQCLSASGDEVRPLVIFMDGFEYHAETQAEDTAKRFAVISAGAYRVWTLGWRDLPGGKEEPGYLMEDWFDQPKDRLLIDGLYDKMARNFDVPGYGQHPEITHQPAFEQLLHYLAEPITAERTFSNWAISRVFGLTDLATSRSQQIALQQTGTWLPEPWQEHHLSGDGLLGAVELQQQTAVTAVAAVPKDAIETLGDAATARETANNNDQATRQIDEAIGSHYRAAAQCGGTLPTIPLSLCLLLDDRQTAAEGYRQTWRRFWSAANLFQFLPAFLPAARSGIDARVYAPIMEYNDSRLVDGLPVQQSSSEDDNWRVALEDTLFGDALQVLASRHCPAPAVGVELQDGDAVGTLLEWLWQDQRIAFADGSPEEEVAALTAEGWRLVRNTDDESLDQLVSWLTGDQ